MITCYLMGGLGNQIFQIFATISYALSNKKEFKFVNVYDLGGSELKYTRYTFWNTFFYALKEHLIDCFPEKPHIIYEKEFRYNKIQKIHNSSDILLYGYFQSHKYFKDNYESICNLIQLQEMKDRVLNKIGANKTDFVNTISIHFRMGDYKKYPECHPIMSYTYYDNSIQKILSMYQNTTLKIIYFCEDENIVEVSNMIQTLNEKYSNCTFVKCNDGLEDWEQLLLMSLCENNIIANSSFSWWAAYFNNNKNKKVCFPSIWFGPALNYDTTDMCPSSWIKIDG